MARKIGPTTIQKEHTEARYNLRNTPGITAHVNQIINDVANKYGCLLTDLLGGGRVRPKSARLAREELAARLTESIESCGYRYHHRRWRIVGDHAPDGQHWVMLTTRDLGVLMGIDTTAAGRKLVSQQKREVAA